MSGEMGWLVGHLLWTHSTRIGTDSWEIMKRGQGAHLRVPPAFSLQRCLPVGLPSVTVVSVRFRWLRHAEGTRYSRGPAIDSHKQASWLPRRKPHRTRVWRSSCTSIQRSGEGGGLGFIKPDDIEGGDRLNEPFEGQVPERLNLHEVLHHRVDSLADENLPGQRLVGQA